MILDVGIDVGSVSINGVVIDDQRKIVWEVPYTRHFGMVRQAAREVLKEVFRRFAVDSIRSVSFTGIHGERLAALLEAPFEVESIAQVLGVTHVVPGVHTIIAMGGQDAALFQLDYEGGEWHLESFNMNGPCASGTGSFIDQQAERLASSMYGEDVDWGQDRVQRVLDDFIASGLKHTTPAPVACRCTVFTKSDMIHLQNKGEPLANIIAGLHHGNAANYLSTIVANRKLRSPIVFIGGMASNRLQVQAFRKYHPDLIVPPHHCSLGALGAGLQAQNLNRRNTIDLDRLDEDSRAGDRDFPRAEPLRLDLTRFDPDNRLDPWPAHRAKPLDCYLGIDVGSTTTKYALIDEQGRIVHKCYLQTRGRPIEVTQKLLDYLRQELGDRVAVRAVATTGSGRNVVGDFLDAELVIDEITAHARGAVEVDPDIDTIFEIGGQDSKYIRIENGHPLDFDMNKVCAAGTGSFLHELANKMKINIVGEFEQVALASREPLHLAERCTVFMESDLMSYAQKGARREDLIAGLCYAIVHNYLNRVVGKRPVGQRVMFLGGPSLNRGIVAAFEKVLGRGLLVPKHREVLGGYGAALAARDAMRGGEVQSKRRKIEELARVRVEFTEKICRADPKCHNECKLKVYDFGGRKSIWGGDCGRYEMVRRSGEPTRDLFLERNELFFAALEGRCRFAAAGEAAPSGDGRVSVGVPLAIHAWEWGIFWVALLSALDFDVVLSPKTNNRIARGGIEAMTAETCFPIKVFHGHVRYLVDQCDYLFLPNVINLPTPQPEESGLFCPLVEGSQYLARAALRIPDGKIIRPTLYLKDGPGELLKRCLKAFPQAIRPEPERLAAALQSAWEEQMAFQRELLHRGRRLLKDLGPDRSLWVISGRPYNLYDERLNLRLSRHLSRLGIHAVPIDFLDLDSQDLSDFPRMYWGLGARVLRAAKRIRETPNWFGVHITNFSCGPDSFVEHFYKQVMTGKPCLILELDEHSAIAGVLTRVEAYQNVVKNVRGERRRSAGEPPSPLEASCA